MRPRADQGHRRHGVCRKRDLRSAGIDLPGRLGGGSDELANGHRYGLNAKRPRQQQRQAQKIAEQLRAGTVHINEGYAAAWG